MRAIEPALLQSYLESDLPPWTPLTSDLHPSRVASNLLLVNLTKKLVNSSSPTEEAANIALGGFLLNNERCKRFRLKPETLLDELIIGEVRKTLDDFFHPNGLPLFNLWDISQKFSVGGGMNVGARDQSFLSKIFHSRLSSTSESLYRLYRMGISHDPNWTAAENKRASEYGLAIVPGSVWTPVLKTSDKARGVATEPTVNMLFQRGQGSLMEDRLYTFFKISLKEQPYFNQLLAMYGSISGYFSTKDQTDASDSISAWLCRDSLPTDAFDWLWRTRSPSITLPGKEVAELYIMSTMGNGYTFALQTAIFASIVVSCLRLSDEVRYNSRYSTRKCDVPGNFGVFGDDIIVPTRVDSVVSRGLKLFGFIENAEKSFSQGSFRESCGADYWNGHNVRSVYAKRLRTQQDVYSLINRLVVFCTKHGLFLENTFRFLLRQVRFLPVPFNEEDTSGLKVSSSFAPQVWSIDGTRSQVYYAYQSVPRTVDLTRSAKSAKQLGYRVDSNPHGLLVAALGGFVRDGCVTLPNRGDTRFKVRRCVTPFWDYVPSAELNIAQADSWKAVSDRVASLHPDFS